MKIVTTYVHDDEPCYGLREGPQMVDVFPNAREWHWTQRVYVLRGDAIAEFTHDFGSADHYEDVIPLAVPGLGDDSVGQLREMAERHRNDRYWQDRSAEMLAESTLIQDWHEQLGERHNVIRNRSVMGPYQRTQRNEFSRETNQRQLKERIDAYYASH